MEKINTAALFHYSYSMDEQSKIGLARRNIRNCLQQFRFSEQFISDTSIIVNELSSNLVKHGQKKRYLLYKPLITGAHKGIEIISANILPFINLKKAMQDGYTTSETLGTGLGAIKRLSSEFFYASSQFLGTILIARKYEGPGSFVNHDNNAIGYICSPLQEESYSGDAIASYQGKDFCRILVTDGLGHGYKAYQASRKAVEVFQNHFHESRENIILAMHQAMLKTRGAAVMIVDVEQDSIAYSGIGNIAGRIYSREKTRGLISQPGTVGANIRKIKSDRLTFYPGEMLILYSDGIKINFQLNPEILTRHPVLVAAGIYCKGVRSNDDSSVLVYKK